MADIRLDEYARLLGSNTVIGMAEKVGLTRPPPRISVRNLVDLAAGVILPFAPVDLLPQNGAGGISSSPDLYFRDPGAGTPAAAAQFEFVLTQNGIIVDPGPNFVLGAGTASPLTPPGVKWGFPLPPGEVTLTVSGMTKAGKKGPASSSTFNVGSLPPTPTPQTKTLTLQVTLSLPAFAQSITETKWSLSGPGSPQAPINSPASGSTSQLAIPLPTPQGPATYTVRSSVAFAYNELVRNNGTSGPENSQVDLSPPTPIPWTGQSRVVRFAITYNSSDNVFIMAFQGLFG